MKKLYSIIGVVIISLVLHAEKPTVILVHGLLSASEDMQLTAQRIKKYMPDTYVKIVNLGFGKWTSFFNMFDQAEWLKMELNSDPNVSDNCIMIGHSQGGLVARYYVQRYNLPRVKTLITWGAPHQGIFGSPGILDQRFSWLNILELYAYKLFYLYPIQKYISIASYWKDPLHHEEYMSQCLFLPHANNEVDHVYNQVYKENIESLSCFVMVNSEAEEMISPSASCHFGFYYIGSNRHIQPFLESEQYHQNLLGLKTLYDEKKLIFKTARCTHMNYTTDEANFIENTLPYIMNE